MTHECFDQLGRSRVSTDHLIQHYNILHFFQNFILLDDVLENDLQRIFNMTGCHYL